MLRLLTAALLTTTAQGSCPACMKYLDETWRTACNQTWAEAQGYDDCPPVNMTLSVEQGNYLYLTCSDNEDLCPDPDAPDATEVFLQDENDPCWTKRHEFVNWGVNAGGCFDCGASGEDLVHACRGMCAADAECLSFEIATERERDYYGMNLSLIHI